MRRRCTSVFPRSAALVAVLLMAAWLTTACSSSSDSVADDDGRDQRRPNPGEVPEYILTDAPILSEGGPSGQYRRVFEFDPHMDPRDRTYVAVEFNVPSYFNVNTSPGTAWSVVTIREGNARIVLTVYRDPADAGAITSRLKEVVEAHYKGAVFQHRPPRLMVEAPDAAERLGPMQRSVAVQTADEWTWWPDPTARIVRMSGGSVVEEGKLGDPDRAGMWKNWTIGKPEVVGTEAEEFGDAEDVVADDPSSGEGDEFKAYVTNRVKTWDWNLGGESNSDLFRRTEHWYHNTSVWDRYVREGANGEVVEGRTGTCRHNGFRYHVIVEGASLGRMIENPDGFRDDANPEGNERENAMVLGDQVAVHVVYFYPESEAPIMQDVIQMFRNSLRAHRTEQPGAEPASSGPDGP